MRRVHGHVVLAAQGRRVETRGGGGGEASAEAPPSLPRCVLEGNEGRLMPQLVERREDAPLPGSAELPRAAGCALKRHRSRAGALPRGHLDHAAPPQVVHLARARRHAQLAHPRRVVDVDGIAQVGLS
eukprot:scaffold22962_cov64-Phaeocystis_antarctica.AAC.5